MGQAPHDLVRLNYDFDVVGLPFACRRRLAARMEPLAAALDL